MSAHVLHVYEYVNRPYERVSSVLRLDAIGVFQRATASATARARALVSTMRATVGPVELGADVVVRVTSVEEAPDAPRGPRTRLRLAWKASQHPELFPTMEATLDVYALGPSETQLDFHGEYHPPFGVVGAVIDAIIGHRVAEAAVHRFVEEIAERLSVDVGASAEVASQPSENRPA
jgi:hypothetical protein